MVSTCKMSQTDSKVLNLDQSLESLNSEVLFIFFFVWYFGRYKVFVTQCVNHKTELIDVNQRIKLF